MLSTETSSVSASEASSASDLSPFPKRESIFDSIIEDSPENHPPSDEDASSEVALTVDSTDEFAFSEFLAIAESIASILE